MNSSDINDPMPSILILAGASGISRLLRKFEDRILETITNYKSHGDTVGRIVIERDTAINKSPMIL